MRISHIAVGLAVDGCAGHCELQCASAFQQVNFFFIEIKANHQIFSGANEQYILRNLVGHRLNGKCLSPLQILVDIRRPVGIVRVLD